MGKHHHNRLSFAKLKSLKERGRYADGGGLWFQVSKSGTRAWVFQFTINGRVRQAGLGGYPNVSLEAARQLASDHRQLVRQGVDPIARRKVEILKTVKFGKVAAEYIEAKSPGWRNPKHRQQWTNTLGTYVYPVIGELPVAEIDKALILKVLKPIWTAKPETADRVRARIEKVLDAAKSAGLRSGENPAKWRSNLEHDFPARSKLARVKHHEALPYSKIPEFMAALRANNSISARALEFLILTATRTGAVIGATWDEIDLEANLWTVSPERAGVKIEGNDPRVVPLSDRAIEILEIVPRIKGNPHVFPGAGAGRLSNMAMLMLLRGMLGKGATVHGFRSAFKDWAAESTGYENIVSEAALWHSVADKVEAAYRRGALLEKRKRLMRDWALYCSRPLAKRDSILTPFRKKERA
jgi:integrase